MAALGGAKSNNFQIGVSELRIGTLDSLGIGILSQYHSVGLLQSASVQTTKTFAELRQGELNRRFYQKQTGVDVEITANMYEFTANNLQLMAKKSSYNAPNTPKVEAIAIKVGLVSNHSLKSGLIRTEPLPTSWSSKLNIAESFLVGVYVKSKPYELYYALAAKAPGGEGYLTLSTDNLRYTYEHIAVGTELLIYPVQFLSLGDAADQFYTMDIVSKQQSSQTLRVFRFWKVSIQSGLEYSSSPDSHGTLPLRAVAFELEAEELEKIQDEDLKKQILANPLGMLITP
jgi:hypothetical protein